MVRDERGGPPGGPTGLTAALSVARDVLDVPGLSVTDDLFDAGMTSLLALRLADRLSETWDREITVTDVYHGGDLAGIHRLGADGPAPTETGEGRTGEALVPLSHAQERFWVAEQFAPAASDNMLVLAYVIDGPLASRKLHQALLDVVGRHLALRTRYPETDLGAMAQTLAPEAVHLPMETVPAPSRPAGEAGLQALAEAITADWWDMPLDLADQPPVRVRLCPVDVDRHLLCLQIHHIAFDGRSEQIFIEELLACYRQRHLAPAPRLRSGPEAAADEADLEFWGRTLSAVPPPFLPAPPVVADEADRSEVSLEVPAATVDGVRLVARRRRIPTLAVLVAAAARALGSVFAAPDLVLGTVSDRRGRDAPDSAIGYFINPVPVVVRSVGTRELGDMLDHAASEVLAALRHSRAPFDELVRRLAPDRGRHPWFQAWVVLQYPVPEGELTPGTTLRAVRVRPPRTATELSVEVFPRSDGSWELRLIWRSDGCARDDVLTVGGRIREALDEIAARGQ